MLKIYVYKVICDWVGFICCINNEIIGNVYEWHGVDFTLYLAGKFILQLQIKDLQYKRQEDPASLWRGS